MNSHAVQFDEAAYRIDAARACARADDPAGVLAGVRGAIAALAGAPYGGILAEAAAAAADAVESARLGDSERADAALVLFAHLVDDMAGFERAESARLLVE